MDDDPFVMNALDLRPMTPDEFMQECDVSRETLERLKIYAAMLEKWQKAINLVGPSTMQDVWRRHMLDSAQLFPFVPEGAKTCVDLGSGAGFPGLVLAIMAAEKLPGAVFHLVESDTRKCMFLREVARECGVNVEVHNRRAEKIPSLAADLITARALANLRKLLDLAQPFMGEHTVYLFLKGQDVDAELTEASKYWNIRAIKRPSRSSPDGAILEIKGAFRD